MGGRVAVRMGANVSDLDAQGATRHDPREAWPAAWAPAADLRYERGTLLLVPREGPLDAFSDLPGVVWDPRVDAFRAPAFRHAELSAELARRSAASHVDVRASGPEPVAWTEAQIRPYQHAALRAWWLSDKRGIVVLPTGAGKTRLAVAAMARTGLRALCLVPTRALLLQWQSVLRTLYSGPIGLYGDGNRQLAAITVATFESAYLHMPRFGNYFDLLVVDEVHHFGRGMRDEALEMSIATARLGLTATPPRDDASLGRLNELVGPVVFELGIDDLTGTYLAPFEVIELRLQLDAPERRAYDEDMRKFREVSARFRDLAPGAGWADFARAAATCPEGREALAAWRRVQVLLAFTNAKRDALGGLLDRHRNARVLVFTADNHAAYAIARQHLIMPLTCDISRLERDAALARFRAGALRALVSARVLNEGIDVPDADVAIIVAGAMGEREHVQRIGRLLRPGQGKRALVYELITRGTIEVRSAEKRRAGLGSRVSRSL